MYVQCRIGGAMVQCGHTTRLIVRETEISHGVLLKEK